MQRFTLLFQTALSGMVNSELLVNT